MGQILLIHENEQMRWFHGLNLYVHFTIDTISKSNLDDALSLLEVHPNIDLIMVQDLQDWPNRISSYLDEHSRKIPKIFLQRVEEFSSTDFNSVNEDIDSSQEIIQKVQSILKTPVKKWDDATLPEHMSIEIDAIKCLSEAPVNLYIRLGAEKGKFVKRYSEGDPISTSELKKFKDHGAKYLYFLCTDRVDFFKAYTNNIKDQILSENDYDKAYAIEAVINNTKNYINDLSKRPDIVEVCNLSLESIQKMVGSFPELSNLWEGLIKNPENEYFNRCQVMTYLLIKISESLNWGSKEIGEKISFAVFFHDILLVGNKLSFIRTVKDKNYLNLSRFEKKLVDEHALTTSNYILKYPNAPLDVETIIKQHHGQLNGIGFGKNIPRNVFPIAGHFMLVEDFVLHLEKNGSIPESKAYIKNKFSLDHEKSFVTNLIKVL